MSVVLGDIAASAENIVAARVRGSSTVMACVSEKPYGRAPRGGPQECNPASRERPTTMAPGAPPPSFSTSGTDANARDKKQARPL